MAKKKTWNKKRITKIFFEYGLHLWLVVFVMNVAIFYAINFYSFGKTCLTPPQIQSDNRCLYILNGKVYEKGTRDDPHQGHPCGTDVTSVVPPSHTNNPAMYLLPNYVGDICSSQPQPTAAPKPTNTPMPTPTRVPTPVPAVATIAVPTHASIPTPTLRPQVVVAATPVPTTATALPTAVVTRAVAQPYTAVPTGAATPTSAPAAGPAIKFSFAMPAIGIGPGSTTPAHPTRAVTLNVYNAAIPLTNLKVPPTYTVTTNATYDASSASPTYTQFVVQSADLGASASAGTYNIAFKTNQIPLTLIKTNATDTQGTLFHLSPGTVAPETPQVKNVFVGDLNGDDAVDIQDYSMFVDCYGSKASSSACLAPDAADLNDNGSVDGVDYILLLESLRAESGISVPVQHTPVSTPTPTVTSNQPSLAISTSSGLSKKISLPGPVAGLITHRPTPSAIPEPTATPTPSNSLFAASSILSLSKVLSYLAFIVLLSVAVLGAYKSRLLNSMRHRGGEAKPKAHSTSSGSVTPSPQPTLPTEQPVALPVEPPPPPEKKQISKVYYITGGSAAAGDGRTMLTLTDDEGAHVGYTSQTSPQDGYYSVSGFEEEIDGIASITILTLTPALKPGTNL